MRRRSLAIVAFLVGCSGGQTQAGPIGGSLDLRQYLPDSLRALKASTSDTTFRQQIKVGPDSAPVEITWTAFGHGTGRYLGTVSARLLQPVAYDSLRMGNPTNLQNDGTKTEVNATATIRVDWFKTENLVHKSGGVDFRFNARGQ